MYLTHFGLEREPFSLTPDPRFLFLSERHREALAHLLYGLGERGGFVQLTGEVGTGKTTLCRSLLEQVPADVDVALLLNPRLTAVELVSSICDELGAAWPAGTVSLKALVDALNLHLLDAHARGRRTVLMIDEAQQLSADVLEQVRLLTNLETPTAKLLQIVLIGQPELQGLMARVELRQLAQRVTARYHLTPLRARETAAYVVHRLTVAGGDGTLFTGAALRKLHRLSGGIPRVVNVIGDRALLGAYARDKRRVGAALVGRAAAEVLGRGRQAHAAKVLGWGVAAVAAAALVFVGFREGWLPGFRVHPGAAAPPAAASPSPTEPSPGPAIAKGLEGWLLSGGTSGGKDSARATLFRLWRRPQGGALLPEAQAAQAGLGWVEGRGDWTLLERYNRPVSVELVSGGRACYAVVTSLDGEDVVLSFAGERGRFSRGELDRCWTGRFSLLRLPVPPGADRLREGAEGPAVEWLRRGLDLFEGVEPSKPAEGDAAVFDHRLRGRVAAFQKSSGLAARGFVGPQTLAALGGLAWEPSLPALRALRRRD